MFKPRLGVSLNFVNRERTTADIVEAVAASRIETLEIPGAFLTDPEQRRMITAELTGKRGPRVVSVHSPFGSTIDISSFDDQARGAALVAARESIAAATELGGKLVVVHPSSEPIEPAQRAQRIRRAREGYVSLADFARAQGCRIAIELLPRTCLGNRVEELFELLDGLDERTFGVCLDVNHLMDRYATLPSVVRALGPRLITLHLSDYDGVDERHWMPGKGVIDWPAFMQALRDIDYQGPFNFESEPGVTALADRIAAFEKCFDWLSGL